MHANTSLAHLSGIAGVVPSWASSIGCPRASRRKRIEGRSLESSVGTSESTQLPACSPGRGRARMKWFNLQEQYEAVAEKLQRDIAAGSELPSRLAKGRIYRGPCSLCHSSRLSLSKRALLTVLQQPADCTDGPARYATTAGRINRGP